MSIFKCKMCGGTIEFEQGSSVGVCDSCGTKQTLPKLDDDKKSALYDRANHFRRNNEYDKAMAIYEQILNEDNTDAEAYWSLVLCRYGIEYVEDPATHKRVPTVNRAQFTSVFADEDYKSALKYADGYQKEIYEQEAKAIDEIQKSILSISQKEEPFDVFICYKETDSNGRRTQDSVLANDLYHQLTQEGFKVFFSRITLEDKLGTAYEPYIFAALNSAKIMVVIGTKAEYFNAVWVKNEWIRYLALVKKSNGKKVLIPAYRDMDPYDLPEEFSHLQAQDMSKLGFMQDLIRGIKKLVTADEPKNTVVKETVTVNNGIDASALLKRAHLFLTDGDWNNAYHYCDRVLDTEPDNAEAYICKLMIDLHVKSEKDIGSLEGSLENNSNFQKIMLFGDEKTKSQFIEYDKSCKYNYAINIFHEHKCQSAKQLFEKIAGFKDANDKIAECISKIEEQEEIHEDNLLRADLISKEKESLQREIKEYEKKQNTLSNILKWTFIIAGTCIVFFFSTFFEDGSTTTNMVVPVIGVIGLVLMFVGLGLYGIIGNDEKYSELKQKVAENDKTINDLTQKEQVVNEFPAVKQFKNRSEETFIQNSEIAESIFSMIVKECFFITGKGTVVSGNITKGSVKINDTVSINGLTYQVLGIETQRRLTTVASVGMDVGLLISKSSIRFERGTIVTNTSNNAVAVDRFTVKLTDPGTNKIEVIKIIREITGLGLAEAKQLSEFVPSTIITINSIDTANTVKARLEAAGARVEIE